jgi:glycosyltransferase involved in cell wall biosynthesis
MRIALLGTRGIPASHGGFETCVEELGRRLVDKGHTVFVYSKQNDSKLKTYKGMHVIEIPRISIKGIETLLSTFLSVIHSLFFHFDMHMLFNGANSPALFIYKLLKKKYALNTDGLEWKRGKWGIIGRNYYKLSERVSVLLCKNLISDSQGIHDYYKQKYHVESTIIAYGAAIPPEYPNENVQRILNELGLEKNKYILQITRFEPENHPLLTLQSIEQLPVAFKCVLVGGSNYRSEYLEKIEEQEQKNKNIILPGYIYHKEKLDILWQNALCYIHGNSVGGTNPALLQAMAAGRPVIALDCSFNREVLGENGYFYFYSKKSLIEQILSILEAPGIAGKKAAGAIARVRDHYSWDKIADQYEVFFKNLFQISDSKF